MSDFLPAHATFAQRFISREAAGLRKPRSVTRLTGTRGNTLHWEGPYMGFPWAHSSCYSKVRGIQAFHMDSRGWTDVAYSSIECPHGYIFEGRWFGARTAANGTNTGNASSFAHCYLGGERDPFTAEGKMAQRHVIQKFEELGSGTGVWPHSHWKATACPGNAIREWLANGRPVAGGTPTQGDDDMTPEQAAWLGNLHHEVVAEGARLDRVEDLLAATRYESALTQQKLDRLIAKLQA